MVLKGCPATSMSKELEKVRQRDPKKERMKESC